jgi:circadian clock protein KaiC
MAHSNQVREFLISRRGIDLVDAYIGPGGALTGASRAAQRAREAAEALASRQDATRCQRELRRKRAELERQIGELRSAHAATEMELRHLKEQAARRTRGLTVGRTDLARLRQADAPPGVARASGQPKPGSRR